MLIEAHLLGTKERKRRQRDRERERERGEKLLRYDLDSLTGVSPSSAEFW